MKRLVAALLLVANPGWAMDVPSGQSVALQEVLVDALGDETWLRFRFVAPQIGAGGEGLSYEAVADDMAHLCTALALPYMIEYGLSGDVIVVSLADRQTEFGQANADATQFFEAYRPVDNICIWEAL